MDGFILNVTGDGVSDALAMASEDVGIAVVNPNPKRQGSLFVFTNAG